MTRQSTESFIAFLCADFARDTADAVKAAVVECTSDGAATLFMDAWAGGDRIEVSAANRLSENGYTDMAQVSAARARGVDPAQVTCLRAALIDLLPEGVEIIHLCQWVQDALLHGDEKALYAAMPPKQNPWEVEIIAAHDKKRAGIMAAAREMSLDYRFDPWLMQCRDVSDIATMVEMYRRWPRTAPHTMGVIVRGGHTAETLKKYAVKLAVAFSRDELSISDAPVQALRSLLTAQPTLSVAEMDALYRFGVRDRSDYLALVATLADESPQNALEVLSACPYETLMRFSSTWGPRLCVEDAKAIAVLAGHGFKDGSSVDQFRKALYVPSAHATPHQRLTIFAHWVVAGVTARQVYLASRAGVDPMQIRDRWSDSEDELWAAGAAGRRAYNAWARLDHASAWGFTRETFAVR